MIQLYFLSIIFNGLTGFLLVMGDTGNNDTIEKNMKFSFTGGGFRLILGILAAITGLLKLLLPMGKMPILGDLIPAAAGLIGGFILIFGFYREHSARAENEGDFDRIGQAFLRYKKIAGIALLVIAALHFLFPAALFL